MSDAKRLVIANRGEIARRILRTARSRGYRVAVISTAADRDALVRLEADDVLEVASFLDSEAIVRAVRGYGASLIHPGYGFLSENAEFAERIEASGIAFVGPSADSMRAMGNKETAKKLASRCGVATLPAVFSEELEGLDDRELAEALTAKKIEAPFLVKAAGGGGGRGMRTAGSVSELRQAIERASEEARSGFGDPTIFVERYLPSPRHIEIQVFGDGSGGGVALGERECSLQRRHQKVVEEAPSPVLSEDTRIAMGEAALDLVAESAYRGAGTAEFLVDTDGEDGEFYFLEMNTRLQVEHPVTEGVFDVDLVDCQLSLAEGSWPSALPDPASRTVLQPRGSAIEVRVLAEDPRNSFLPTPGPLLIYREPQGPGVRVDSGVREGDRVNPEYDSMIAKLVVRGASRAQAIERLDRALDRMVVVGTETNLPLLRAIVRHPDFVDARFSTDWLGRELENLNRPLVPEALSKRLASPRFAERVASLLSRGAVSRPGPPAAARRFASLDSPGLRVGDGYDAPRIDIVPGRAWGSFAVSGPGIHEALHTTEPIPARFGESLKGAMRAARRERSDRSSPRLIMWAATSSGTLMLQVGSENFRLPDPRHAVEGPRRAAAADGGIRAPMAGKVLEVRVSEGSRVAAGEVLFVVESMKMQLEIRAPDDGVISKVYVEAGEVLDGPATMAECDVA